MAFEWHITEDIPANLGGRPEGGAVFRVESNIFDVAIGDVPFLLNIDERTPYERVTVQWRKDQFDNLPHPGEQSLSGWWLRSQTGFEGGAGIQFFEPLVNEDSGTRFRESFGVEVFDEPGEVSLLPDTTLEVEMPSADVEAVSSGDRVLLRNSAALSVWDGLNVDEVTISDTPVSLALGGSVFLIGTSDGIDTLDTATGTTTTALWTDAGDDVRVWWAKERIFAAIGPELYELTMAGGDLSEQDPLYTHPDPNWEWVAVTETSGAAWAAGHAGGRSAVHVIDIDESGETPDLVGGVVRILLPLGERVTTIHSYIDYLLVGTSEGLRVAVTDGNAAALGPLVWDDEEVLSLDARSRYAFCGLGNGLTRKVDLGNEVAGELSFAWANHVAASGDVLNVLHFDGDIHLACSGVGLFGPDEDLVSQGSISTGFIRFGTLESKSYDSVRVTGDVSAGSIELRTRVADDDQHVANLANFNGSRDVRLRIPGGSKADQVALTFVLTPGETDGPVLRAYQLRAMPIPANRQRLIRFPFSCYQSEADRFGVKRGGPGFARARLRTLERLEETGVPILMQDFRTGEARRCVVEDVHYIGLHSPSRQHDNFGGKIQVTVRTVD